MQTPRGSVLPAATVKQWPGEVARLQLRHAPVQAFSQQTPSTHCPVAHSLPPAQVNPSGFGPQVPATQAVPVSQSLSV